MDKDVYKIMLVTYLHDVGKVLQRAGKELKNLCNLNTNEFYEHDAYSCDFIKEYLGDEYVKLFEEKVWNVADQASARERITAENLAEVATTPLLAPDVQVESNDWLSRHKDEKVWYSVTYLDLSQRRFSSILPPGNYSLKKMSDAFVNYKGIVEKLEDLAKKIRGLKDAKSLLETYEYIYRSLMLFVPAAVYKSIPNTSLYGHSRLASAFSPFKKFKAVLIDIKGIQRFISNVQKEADASKRFRGRSLFLQLLQQAIVDYIAESHSLSEINNLSFEPGKILFLLNEDCDTSKIRAKLLELEDWLEYELQFSVKESKSYSVSDLYFYNPPPGKSVFEDLLRELFEDYEIIGKTDIIEDNEVDRYGVVSRVVIKADMKNIDILSSLAPGSINVGDSVSLISLITLIIGHTSRNLRYIVEVIHGNEKDDEQSYDPVNGVGKITITPLGTSFYLIHEKRTDVEAVLHDVIRMNKDKAKRIKVFTVNETIDFIHEDLLKEFGKISFGYILLNTYHPTGEKENFKSLDSMGNFIGLGIIDGDRIGEKVKELSKYPSRFMAFSSILNFVFTYIPVFELGEKIQSGQKPDIVILYAGGDDVAVYGKWDEVLELLAEMQKYVKDMLYQVTVSGGLFIFKPAYPIYYAYKNAKDLEDNAKEQRKVLQSGVVDSNIFEHYYVNGNRVKGLRWDEAKEYLQKARELLKVDISNSFLYKLYNTADMIEGKDKGKKENTNSEAIMVAKGLVTYAYLVARNDKEFEKLKKVYPIEEYKGVNKDDVINQLLKLRTLINIYSFLRRT